MTRRVEIPELSLVLLIGASGSGKSTFARRSFLDSEVLSSDRFRAWVSDDENDQSATSDAFDALRYVAGIRLARGRIVVVDATNVQPEARRPMIELAREHDLLPIAIVLDVPEATCVARNASRTDRRLGAGVVRRQVGDLRRSIRSLAREGLRQVHVLGEREIDDAIVVRQPLWSDRKHDHGPFDVIGDVHGCCAELEALLRSLGYARDAADDTFAHSGGRKVVFVGDLVDRGPDSPGCLEIAMRMVARGSALCVPGNHEVRLLRKLRGKDVKLTHGLAETMAQMEGLAPEQRDGIASFVDGLVSHVVLDEGRLVVAHAGMKEKYQGRASGRVREFALYGETTGEIDQYGLPVRADWAAEYRGRAAVVYGHTPVVEAEWVNGTMCIDTGCVFGGKLTALRWPERELVSVQAERVYHEPVRPLAPAALRGAQHEADDLLDVADVLSRLRVETRLAGTVIVPEANVRAALEVLSRFAADPRWLVYLPPTMSPSTTSARPGLLEHPDEALDYYRDAGVAQVVCEEKHMGSRMVVVIARDGNAAKERFGVSGTERGACLTRTGRRFFGTDRGIEQALLDRLDRAITRAGLWDELGTEWMVIDAELLPWSAKAQELLRDQYALAGSAGTAALGDAASALDRAASRGIPEIEAIRARTHRRAEHVARYVASYRRYCWPIGSIEDYRIAPFHLMASEGAVHSNRDHLWHLERLGRLAENGEAIVIATPHRLVDLGDPVAVAGAITWWEERTSAGSEGMVVKPLDFLAKGRKGLLQPAIKCRGPEYLRIIYGPEYPEQLDALRSRGVGRKRSLAMRELALGLESLDRFVRREPLRRVHECALALVALESEPVDPRL